MAGIFQELSKCVFLQQIVLFHNDFSPNGEQPEQRILAYKL